MRLINLLAIAAPLALALWIAGLIVWRRAFGQFPAFNIYIAYSILNLSARLAIIGNWPLYFKVYWITEVGDVCLALAAIYQLSFTTFRGLALLTWCKVIVTLTACAVTTYSAWRALFRPPVRLTQWDTIIVGFEVGFQCLIASMCVLFFAAKKFLRFPNRRHSFIAFGFGVSSSGMLAATLLRSEFGNKFPLAISWGPSVAYLAALVLWLLAFQISWQEEDLSSQITIESAAKELESYASALKKVER